MSAPINEDRYCQASNGRWRDKTTGRFVSSNDIYLLNTEEVVRKLLKRRKFFWIVDDEDAVHDAIKKFGKYTDRREETIEYWLFNSYENW